jgi:ribokinase
MASDRGVAADLHPEEIDPTWLECDHLHVSGYALAREPMRGAADRAIVLARERGARVSVDLAASTMIGSVEATGFRALLIELAPDVVFCNEDEEQAIGGPIPGPAWIVKRGARGASVDGATHAATAVAQVVDSTGAGDAFAAGWIVDGISLAFEAAARCIAQVGAMPVDH